MFAFDNGLMRRAVVASPVTPGSRGAAGPANGSCARRQRGVSGKPARTGRRAVAHCASQPTDLDFGHTSWRSNPAATVCACSPLPENQMAKFWIAVGFGPITRGGPRTSIIRSVTARRAAARLKRTTASSLFADGVRFRGKDAAAFTHGTVKDAHTYQAAWTDLRPSAAP